MHSSIANCHIWSDHSPHSQTPQTPYFGYDRNSGPVVMSSDITMFCCDDVVLALGPQEAASPHVHMLSGVMSQYILVRAE